MVSVHNTINYHNHIYNFPEDTFSIHENTIFDYINKQHPDIFENVNNNLKLKDTLNNIGAQYTMFISINNDIDNLHDYLFKGHIILEDDDQYILDNLNHKRYKIMDGKINDKTIIIKNIKCKNGILHIMI